MTRIKAVGQLILLVVSGLSYVCGLLLVIGCLFLAYVFFWQMLLIDPSSPFDEGLFGKAALKLLGAILGVGLGILFILYAKHEFQRVRAKVKSMAANHASPQA